MAGSGEWMYPSLCSSNSSCLYRASWSLDQILDVITFIIVAKQPVDTWTAIGFAPKGAMSRADVIYGYITSQGRGFVTDAWIEGRWTPPTIDYDQNLLSSSITYQDGYLILIFSRYRQSPDLTNDYSFTNTDCYSFLFPVGGGPFTNDEGGISRHFNTPFFTFDKICILSTVHVSDIRSSSGPYSSSTTTTTTSTSSTSTTTSTTTTKSPLGTHGTAETSTSATTSRPLSSTPKTSTTLHTPNENAINSTNTGSANVALAIGLGVGLGLLFIILIVVVIVVVAAVRRRRHQNRNLRRNGETFESGDPRIANSTEISTSSPSSVLPTVENDANDHYQQLQNRHELQEQRQYEQLPQSPQYEQLQNRYELQEQQQYEQIPQPSHYEQLQNRYELQEQHQYEPFSQSQI